MGFGMTHPLGSQDPTFLPASLAASNVGTWDYDVVENRLRYCGMFASLYGLPAERGGEGLPMEDVAAKIYPDDRPRRLAKRMYMLRHGGTFVFEYRVLSSPQVTRWLLLRGTYKPDADGRIRRGRGIAVDVTEGKLEGYAEGDVFFVTEADNGTVSALDRATRHLLAVRRALAGLGPEAEARLRPATDALLLEMAQIIAGTMVPVVPKRTQH